jgi:hypothetical protein
MVWMLWKGEKKSLPLLGMKTLVVQLIALSLYWLSYSISYLLLVATLTHICISLKICELLQESANSVAEVMKEVILNDILFHFLQSPNKV